MWHPIQGACERKGWGGTVLLSLQGSAPTLPDAAAASSAAVCCWHAARQLGWPLADGDEFAASAAVSDATASQPTVQPAATCNMPWGPTVCYAAAATHVVLLQAPPLLCKLPPDRLCVCSCSKCGLSLWCYIPWLANHALCWAHEPPQAMAAPLAGQTDHMTKAFRKQCLTNIVKPCKHAANPAYTTGAHLLHKSSNKKQYKHTLNNTHATSAIVTQQAVCDPTNQPLIGMSAPAAPAAAAAPGPARCAVGGW